jgi:hypothetical protein
MAHYIEATEKNGVDKESTTTTVTTEMKTIHTITHHREIYHHYQKIQCQRT